MIIGSILARFSKIELSTADEKHYTLKNNFATRIALKVVGIPHLGFRMRSRIILREAFDDSSKHVLDAGCGYGLYSLSLAEKGYFVDSIDIDDTRMKAFEQML